MTVTTKMIKNLQQMPLIAWGTLAIGLWSWGQSRKKHSICNYMDQRNNFLVERLDRIESKLKGG